MEPAVRAKDPRQIGLDPHGERMSKSPPPPTAFSRWMRRNARKRFLHIRPFVEGDHLLDVGSAEGWVGEWAVRQTGMAVDLVDVVNLNRTALPHRVYDGRRLPFPDRSRDTVSLLLTLHHCEEPETVLAESARVARKRVIVTESVYRTRPGKVVLSVFDRAFNGPRARGSMPPALHFKTVGEWHSLFTRHGLRIVHEDWLSRGFHQQRLFVLEPGHRSRPASSRSHSHPDLPR